MTPLEKAIDALKKVSNILGAVTNVDDINVARLVAKNAVEDYEESQHTAQSAGEDDGQPDGCAYEDSELDMVYIDAYAGKQNTDYAGGNPNHIAGLRAVAKKVIWGAASKINGKLCDEVTALQKFKDYVHKRLDEAGIPAHPEGAHSKHGCRIGDRLDIALSTPPRELLEKVREALEGWRDAVQNRGFVMVAHQWVNKGESALTGIDNYLKEQG